MIKIITDFIRQWEKNNHKLYDYIKNNKQSKYDDYDKILELLLNLVIDGDTVKINKNSITKINIGGVRGSIIFVFHEDGYEEDLPLNKIYITCVQYGSCTSCDTILRISNRDKGLPTNQQAKDYMKLALHLLQNCKRIKDI